MRTGGDDRTGPNAPRRAAWVRARRGFADGGRETAEPRMRAADQRRAAEEAVAIGAAVVDVAAAPAAPGAGAPNWVPVGPSCTSRDTSRGHVAISGRVKDLAVGPEGNRAYIAAADGGVWRYSRDPAVPGSDRWEPLGDFTTSPVVRDDSNALACGSLHVAFGAAADGGEDKIMVGTGESVPVVNVFEDYSYHGIGIRVSDDGGATWTIEANGQLGGQGIYALFPDPNGGGVVWAAASNGLYRRDGGAPGSNWVAATADGLPAGRPVHFTDVVIGTFAGARAVFGAVWRQRVYRLDGEGTAAARWVAVPGMSRLTSRGRMCLAVAPTDASVVYVVDQQARMYRLHNDRFSRLQTAPRKNALLPGDQGNYDLGLSVSPGDENTIFVTGDFSDNPRDSSGELSLWRSTLTFGGGRWRFGVANNNNNRARAHRDPTWKGTHLPPDGHRIRFGRTAAGDLDPDQVWVGCDGGVYRSADGGDLFDPVNTGLATLQPSYFDHHPTRGHEILVGFQDNALGYGFGDQAFREAFASGDGGGVAFDPGNPQRLIGQGSGDNAWVSTSGPGGPWRYATNSIPANTIPFYTDITPSPAAPGAGPLAGLPTTLILPGFNRIHISRDWGNRWFAMSGSATSVRPVTSLVFAAFDRFYLSDTRRVYRYDGTVVGAGANRRLRWTRNRLPGDVPRGPSPGPGQPRPRRRPITDLTVNPGATAADDEIFVTLGGPGPTPDPVLRYDPAGWQPAGLSPSYTVAAMCVTVDTSTGNDLYVGTDTGVWHGRRPNRISPFAWSLFSDGLPEVTVLDVKIHQPSRLLRAGLHGRGLWEISLTSPDRDPGVYLKASPSDDGRRRPGTVQAAVAAPNRDPLAAFDASPDIRVRRGIWATNPGPTFVAPVLRRRTPPMPANGQSTADIIRRWQRFLARRGITIAETGVYDRQSRDATREFQRRVGLVADGQVGERTWAAGVTNPALAGRVDFRQLVADVREDIDQATGIMLADAAGPNDVLAQVAMRGHHHGQLPGAVTGFLLVTDASAAPLPDLPGDWSARVRLGDTTDWVAGSAWRFGDPANPATTNAGPMTNREPQVLRWTVDFGAIGFNVGDELLLVTAVTCAEEPLIGGSQRIDQTILAEPGVVCRRVRLVTSPNIP
ncbi:MAG: peptidoglycan-binding domain-containing protein [Actinomycetota bacterium]